jgi:hypothetical protein
MRGWVLAAWLLPATAFAADKEAERLTAEGIAAFQRGDHQQALDSFEQAFLIAPSPTLRYQQGRALSALNRDLPAANAFEAFLIDPGDATAEDQESARAQLVELDKKLGGILVTCNPACGDLTLDGGPLAEGARVRVSPGKHELRATRPAYSARLHISAGETARPSLMWLAEPKPTVTAPPPEKKKRSAARSWWLWTMVGAAAAGGAIAAGVLLAPVPRGCDTIAGSGLGCIEVGARR